MIGAKGEGPIRFSLLSLLTFASCVGGTVRPMSTSFLHCIVARKLWCFIFGIHGEGSVCCDSVEALFTLRFLSFGGARMCRFLGSVRCSVLRGIWSEMSSCIFWDKELNFPSFAREDNFLCFSMGCSFRRSDYC